MFPRWSWKFTSSLVAVILVVAIVLSTTSAPSVSASWTKLRQGGHSALSAADVVALSPEQTSNAAEEEQEPLRASHTSDELDLLLHPNHPPPELSDKDCDMRIKSGSIPEPDTFAEFKQAPGCSFTTAQMHYNFEPKCKDRKSLLAAMNGGGRHGLEAPYASLGCDFHWFNADEVCEIMGRFDRIYFVGDSLMRQLVVAMHTVVRKDLVEGGRQSWRDDNPPEMDCRCRVLFARGSKCFWWEAIDTDSIYKNVPDSIPCTNKIASMSLQARLAWPLPNDTWEDSIHGFTEKHVDGMREVYILGHGTWNVYNTNDTRQWIAAFEDHWRDPIPWYFKSPRLFISPSALSENKPARYLESGNNIMVQRFIREISPWLEERGYDHLAPYNMTVQSMSEDGTHANLEASLIEAMFVINWLSML